jgi:hypothetical protein
MRCLRRSPLKTVRKGSDIERLQTITASRTRDSHCSNVICDCSYLRLVSPNRNRTSRASFQVCIQRLLFARVRLNELPVRVQVRTATNLPNKRRFGNRRRQQLVSTLSRPNSLNLLARSRKSHSFQLCPFRFSFSSSGRHLEQAAASFVRPIRKRPIFPTGSTYASTTILASPPFSL